MYKRLGRILKRAWHDNLVVKVLALNAGSIRAVEDSPKP